MREYFRSTIVLWRAPAEVKKKAEEEIELRYEGNDAVIVAYVPPDLAQKLERYSAHD